MGPETHVASTSAEIEHEDTEDVESSPSNLIDRASDTRALKRMVTTKRTDNITLSSQIPTSLASHGDSHSRINQACAPTQCMYMCQPAPRYIG